MRILARPLEEDRLNEIQSTRAEARVLTLPPKVDGCMFSKCANSRCSASFRHLHEGRLFMFEVKRECSEASGCGPSAEVMGKVHGLHGLRYAWLCDSCAKRLDVTLDDDGGLQMVTRAA